MSIITGTYITTHAIMDLLRRCNEEGMTTVMAIHNSEYAGYAQRILWVTRGPLIGEDRSAKVAESQTLWATIRRIRKDITSNILTADLRALAMTRGLSEYEAREDDI